MPERNTMIREFITVYRLYRWHGARYAAKTAWRIAVLRHPF
jgi:hypothetical protein